MGYFKNKGYFYKGSPFLEHSANKKHAEYGTANSTSSEKGTDGKKNNTSEYNHKYYEENKEKWDSNSKKRNFEKLDHYDPNGDDEDFKKVYGDDLKNPKLNTDTRIKGTDFYTVTNKDGQVVLINGNKKWTLPKGVTLTDGMKQQLAGIDSNKGTQTGDFQTKMEKFLDAAKKETGKSADSSSAKKSSSTKKEETSAKTEEKKEESVWDKTIAKYSDKKAESDPKAAAEEAQRKGKAKTEAEKKKSNATTAAAEAQKKGKTRTQKEKKKQTKQTSQFKHSDIGSVLVKDIF